ncbi:MAG: DUF4143 domain-containing protein [Bacteroidales bacterium]|nr:DUF4143 domain-containing protein [Bacteroidales bacterium]
MIWFDTGMVNYQAQVRKEIIGASDVLDVWKGRIAEQVVAQELLALSDNVGTKRSFWARPNNGAEIDFLYVYHAEVYPIEVKNGTNAHLRSLQVFINNAPVDIAFRIWSGAFSVDSLQTQEGKRFRLVNLPFYLIGQLEAILERLLIGQPATREPYIDL